MRAMILALLLALVCCPAAAAERKPHPVKPPPAPVVLLDETFDGPAGAAPNPALWVPMDYCDGWGADSCNLPSNAVLDGAGNLALTARYAPGHVDRYGTTGFNWTGARVETGRRWNNTALFSFFHGVASAWIRMPAAVGTWTGFWMLNLKDAAGRYGEVDIVEALGHETPGGVWHANVHSWTDGTHMAGAGAVCDRNADLTADFHKYSVEWGAGAISILIDDVLCLSVTSAQSQPWHYDFAPAWLLLSHDVGGWAGPATDVSQFPVSMRVARVTVTS